MLAQTYKQNKVVFPCVIQPKLDGIRCRAEIRNGEVKLWSRDNKPIISMDHIVEQLSNITEDCDLDGELYTPDLPFEVINGIVRRHYHDEESRQIDYYLYDIVLLNEPYDDRYERLASIFTKYLLHPQPCHCRLVDKLKATNHDDVLAWHGNFVSQGYEGAMVRTELFDKKTKQVVPTGYQSKFHTGHTRSWTLMKFKEFDDAEFEIVGMEEEYDLSGNPKGRLGALVCKLTDGRTFKASGISAETKEHAWREPGSYIGRMATIKYFGTSQDGIPRFPNFIAVRWDGE